MDCSIIESVLSGGEGTAEVVEPMSDQCDMRMVSLPGIFGGGEHHEPSPIGRHVIVGKAVSGKTDAPDSPEKGSFEQRSGLSSSKRIASSFHGGHHLALVGPVEELAPVARPARKPAPTVRDLPLTATWWEGPYVNLRTSRLARGVSHPAAVRREVRIGLTKWRAQEDLRFGLSFKGDAPGVEGIVGFYVGDDPSVGRPRRRPLR